MSTPQGTPFGATRTCSLCGRGGDAAKKLYEGRSIAVCFACLKALTAELDEAARIWRTSQKVRETAPDSAWHRLGMHINARGGPYPCDFCGEDSAEFGWTIEARSGRKVCVCGGCGNLGFEIGELDEPL